MTLKIGKLNGHPSAYNIQTKRTEQPRLHLKNLCENIHKMLMNPNTRTYRSYKKH